MSETKRVSIIMTASEYDLVKRAADYQGLNVSAFLRTNGLRVARELFGPDVSSAHEGVTAYDR